MRRAVLAAALAVVLTACGGGGEEDAAGIDVSGGSAEDERIGTDLRVYVERGCRRVSSLEELRAGIARAEEPPPAVIRRYLVRRYGSVERAFQGYREVCATYRTISVEDGVITVETRLQGERAKLLASDICDTIQASDVADFTSGHRVLGIEGEVLATCPRRTG